MSNLQVILVTYLILGLTFAQPPDEGIEAVNGTGSDFDTVDTDAEAQEDKDTSQEATILIPEETEKISGRKGYRFKDLIFKSKPVFEELLSFAQRKILDVADRIFTLKYNTLPVKKIDSTGTDSSEAVEVKAFELLSSVVGKTIRNTLLCSTVTDRSSRYARKCIKEGMTILTQREAHGGTDSDERESDPLCSPLDPATEHDPDCKAQTKIQTQGEKKTSFSGPPLQCVMVLRSSSKSGKSFILPTNGDLDQAIVDRFWDKNSPTKIILTMIPFEFMKKRGQDKKMSKRIALALSNKYGNAENHNILEIHWPEVSTKRLSIVQIAARLLKTGKLISRILKRWHDKKQIQLEKVHMIGCSVGAHLAGVVGNLVTGSVAGQSIGRITGLDPLGWGFDEIDGLGVDPELELTKDDAKFVDVIHTSAPDSTYPFVHYGSNEKRGTVDFYPNNGRARYCSPTDGLCHHLYSVVLYLSSITGKNFVACKCSSWDNLVIRGKCSPCPETATMGEAIDKRGAKGVYFIATA